MMLLKPSQEKDEYLIVKYWEKEDDFKAWTGSTAFMAVHKRGFEDVRKARESGLEPPMRSTFKTYTFLTTYIQSENTAYRVLAVRDSFSS